MRFSADLFTCIVVTIVNIRCISSVHQTENCTLQPSELGPDWYKVSRPVPPGLDGKPAYEPSYIHMPCAKTTVFDIGVCGCTSLMSFIFTSVNRRKTIHLENGDVKLDPDDFVKQLDESTTQRPPPGSLLINTRTGEVKECPFRASSRGQRWYLIREPRDHWRHMICAPGTVFEKRRCTCVHQLIASREPDKPEDSDIVIIEEDWTPSDKTISHSLGISVSDVDFSTGRHQNDIPFWRREDIFDSNHVEEKPSSNGRSDVKVTLNAHEPDIRKKHKDMHKLDIGKDAISDGHKDLLFKSTKRRISHTRTKISPLVLDSNLQNRFDFDNNFHSDRQSKADLITAKDLNSPIPGVKSERNVDNPNDILNVLDQISTKIDALQKKKTADSNKENNTARNTGPPTIGFYEEMLHDTECTKRPLPDLGPQYFLLHVVDIGDIPFTCHGNAIYNDTLCACVPTKDDIAYDEVSFPITDCTRKALPELGPQYFLDHLFGIGSIPFVCHGNKFFDERSCACV